MMFIPQTIVHQCYQICWAKSDLIQTAVQKNPQHILLILSAWINLSPCGKPIVTKKWTSESGCILFWYISRIPGDWTVSKQFSCSLSSGWMIVLFKVATKIIQMEQEDTVLKMQAEVGSAVSRNLYWLCIYIF